MSYGLAVSPRYKTATLDAGDTIVDLGSPDPFPVIAATDVKVFRTRAGVRAQLVLDADYAVSLLNQLPGARVTLASGALQGDVIEVVGKRPIARPTDLNDGQKFSEEGLNAEFDVLTIEQQEARRDIDRTVTSPLGEAGLEMPEYDAGKALAWDSAERKLINAPYAPGDIASAVIAAAASAGAAAGSAGAAAGSAGAAAGSAGAAEGSATAAAGSAGVAVANAATAAVASTTAQAARDASLYGKGIFPTTAAAIGLGIVGHGAITPGATGTDGTFDLAFTGGIGSGAAGRFVVAGGVLTQILITAPGSYTVAPAFSFAASAGLAGAAAAVVLGANANVGEYFWAPVSAETLGLYSVSAGPVATDTGVRSATRFEEYGVTIYKSDGIDLGGYYAERSASVASTLTKIFAEIIASDIGAEVDFYLAVNGSVAYGPETVVFGAPISISGLSIAIGEGDQISFFILYMAGNVTDFFAKTYGEIV